MKICLLTGALLLILEITGGQVPDDSGARNNLVGLGRDGTGNGLENYILWNYLKDKQMERQMQQQRDLFPELQRKRSGWKQCAFNAVSCFGRK